MPGVGAQEMLLGIRRSSDDVIVNFFHDPASAISPFPPLFPSHPLQIDKMLDYRDMAEIQRWKVTEVCGIDGQHFYVLRALKLS